MATLIYLLRYLTHSLKNHKSVHLIALDFSKAFDTVRHYTLATKIANFPISDNVYNWIINFLTDRQHQTKANGCTSTCQHINASIVQGSGLGPVAYLLNASDLRPIDQDNIIFRYAAYIDADLSMKSQVQQTVTSCFAVLRQLRSIRRSVPQSVYQTLIISLVLTRLDNGNATLAGISAALLNRLQLVLNAAARSIAGLRRSDHITVTQASLHWLRAPEQITFKLAVIIYCTLHGTAPRYLSDQLHRVADMPSRSQ